MPRKTITRKARFKAALALVGKTQTEWAKDHGVHPVYLSAVLSPVQPKESKSLEMKVDLFISMVERQMAKRIAA